MIVYNEMINGYVIKVVIGISTWLWCKLLHDWIYGYGIKGYVIVNRWLMRTSWWHEIQDTWDK